MKEKYAYFLFFLLVGIYIGYLQIINYDNMFYILYVLCFFIVLISQSKCFGLVRNTFSVGIFCWLVYVTISIFRTYSIDSGIKYSVVIIIFSLSGVVMAGMANWTNIFYGILSVLLTGHVLFTLFSVFFLDKALEISGILLPNEAQALTKRWAYEAQHFAGLSGQTVMNALFFAILLGIFISEVLIQKSRYMKIILSALCMLLVILLVLTGKKASVLVAAMGIVVTGFYYYFTILPAKKVIKIYYTIGVLIVFFSFVGVMFINQDLFNSFMGTSIVSRERIFIGLGDFFQKAPLLGNGVDSITFYVGHSAHNNYIQLLCEYGIIGFVMILFLQMAIIIDIIRLGYIYMKQNLLNNNGKRAVLFFCFYQTYFIFTGLFESTFFNYRMYLIYIFSIAACYSVFNFNVKERSYK